MDIKAEIGRHTDEAEQIISSYLPKEEGYQKTVIEAFLQEEKDYGRF